MTNLNFANLFDSAKKTVGQRGTGGTTSIHAGLARPTLPKKPWDTMGQMPNSTTEELEMSHLSHREKNAVGHGKPSVYAGVPCVPRVPPGKYKNKTDREAFEERAAIMEFDGDQSRDEAGRLGQRL